MPGLLSHQHPATSFADILLELGTLALGLLISAALKFAIDAWLRKRSSRKSRTRDTLP